MLYMIQSLAHYLYLTSNWSIRLSKNAEAGSQESFRKVVIVNLLWKIIW